MMRNKILGLLAVGFLATPTAVNAVTITYSFTVTATSGPLSGQESTGHFSFDSDIIPVGGGVVHGQGLGLLTDLSFTWNGVLWDETTANTFEGAFWNSQPPESWGLGYSAVAVVNFFA